MNRPSHDRPSHAPASHDPASHDRPSHDRPSHDRPSEERLLISVVIPARDDSQELRGVLAALAAQRRPADEIIVVDNASRDDTASVARAAGARVIAHAVPGIPGAAAVGYDAAAGDVIARLDADSRPSPDWIAAVERVMSRDLDAATGAGHFHDLPRGVRLPASVAYLGAYFVFTWLATASVPLWGSAMALRTSAWRTARANVNTEADVHDDMDLTFALGPHARIAFSRSLNVQVSGRSVRPGPQVRRRWTRAWTTLRLGWRSSPPWERWQSRITGTPRS